MKKKNIFIVLILIIILVALIVGVIILREKNTGENGISISADKDIYLDIIRNAEKNEELTLNAGENIKYYYFDIVNYNTIEQKLNQTQLTPYVKIVFNNNDENKFINWKLYYMNSETDLEESWLEITEKGEEETDFAEYYKCMDIGAYNSENENENKHHYVLKIVLDTENEQFTNLEENLTESFSIVLGYRETK